MKSILAIAKVTVVEQIRNRLYLVIIFFGAIMMLAALLLGVLAPGFKVRVIFDVGLLAIELFGLTAAVFGAVSLVLQEIETKTIYLLLTRPLPRSFYIFGRFLGLVCAVMITMALMAFFHLLVMLSDMGAFKEFTAGHPFWISYFLVIAMSMAKMLVTSAVAIFFSLFATSAVSALTFTGFFWIAGHFWSEMEFLIQKSHSGFFKHCAKVLSYVIPNYYLLNFRDTYVTGIFDFAKMGWAVLYAACYALVFLLVSSALFSRKEF